MSDLPDTVLVLCTGRCGSTTLARAFAHATNYTAGHETRTHLHGAARLAYPARHIEADNRLSWLLGRLDAAWGDRAVYVHLTRDRDAVARSFAARADKGILKAYREEILMSRPRQRDRIPVIESCYDYVDTVTANIRHFLRDKSHVAELALERAADDVPALWRRIGAEGDLGAALAEFEIRHNATA